MIKTRLLIALILLAFGFSANAQNNIIETIAGIASSAGSTGDGGQASLAKLSSNYLLAMDAAGNLYIADNGNGRVRMINAATGIITTVAGSATAGFSGDGAAATAAQLGAGGGPNVGVVGIAIDPAANFLYICDATNNRIRMVNMSTGIINTICGNGTAGFAGDGGPATAATCEVNAPRGIEVTAAGDLYFSDAGNNRIRVISAATGLINTIGGNGTAGYVADGVAATTTKINGVRGLSVDVSGNVYIADQTNDRIRRIDAITNIITTVAGTGSAGFTADGIAATNSKLNLPTDVKFDAAGNMYIADVSNNRIRMVNTSGIISTVAGSGTSSFAIAGDGGLATAAAVRTNSPVGVAIAPSGRYFYFSDRNFDVVRQVRPNSIPYFTGGTRQSITMCENATGDSLKTLLAVIDSDQKQTLTWSGGAWTPINGTVGLAGTAATTGGSVQIGGLYYLPNAGYSGADSFTVQISDGISTSTDTIVVTINPIPVVAPFTGSGPVCVGASIVLGETTTGGTWSESTGNTSVTGGTVNGLIAGTDVISYTLTNVCGTSTASLNVTVIPAPDAGTIMGSSSVCSGGTTVLTDAATGGAWSASNGNASVAGGTVTGNTAGTSDVISYAVTNTCGTATTSVTVNIITTIGGGSVLSGLSVVCQGSSIVLTNPNAGGTWSESTGNSSVTGGTVTGVAGGTDIITYALSNTCGTNNITKTITVNPLPNAGVITGLNNVCLAGTLPLADAAPGGTWSASNAHATVSGTGLVTGVTVGVVVISYTVSNGCGASHATSTVNVISSPSAGTITGSATVCQSGTSVLTDATMGGTWTSLNANATVAGGTVTGVTSGTDVISYTVSTSCGTAYATKSITINPLPAPALIGGLSYVCLGATTSLSDATTGGVWSVSNTNASITGSGLVSGLVAGQDTINYSVTNGCGTTTVTVNMSINTVVTPAISFSASPGFTTCPSTSVTYTANPVNGGGAPVYQWAVNGSVLGSGAAFIYTPSNGDHISCKMSSSLSCISATAVSDTVAVVVNPSLVPTVHITDGVYGDTVCTGNTITYTATETNGGTAPTYQWNVNGSVYSFSNPFSYVPANGDIVTCLLTSNYVCPLPATVTSNTITMTVNTTETPTVNITVAPSSTICEGGTATFTAHSLYGGPAPFFRWSKNGVNVATGPEYIYIPSNGDVVYAMLSSSATCSLLDSVFSNNITMAVLVPSVIAISISSSPGNTVSVHQDDTLTAVVTGTLSPNYQWFVNGGAVSGATNSTYIVNSSLAGTELVNCVSGGGDACSNIAISNVISISISDVGVQMINSKQNELTLAPNPNKGFFTLNLQSFTDEPVDVIVTNTVGEKVLETTTTTNKATDIKISQPAGVYFLTARTANSRNVVKVVVE